MCTGYGPLGPVLHYILLLLLQLVSGATATAPGPLQEDVVEIPVTEVEVLVPTVPSATSTSDKGVQARPSFRSKEVSATAQTCDISTQTMTTLCEKYTQTDTVFQEEPLFYSTPVKQPPPPLSPGYTPAMMEDTSQDTTMDWEEDSDTTYINVKSQYVHIIVSGPWFV